MRRLHRRPLSREAEDFLAKRTDAVKSSKVPKEAAERLWKTRTSRAFTEIRSTLRRMASGLERCMYCEDSAGTDIEHFWPKSAYPERAFSWENYLWACSHCNSNEKRTEFPLDSRRRPLLINPTAEDPLLHLALSPLTGKFQPLSKKTTLSWKKATQSCDVFGLNRQILEQGRRNAWISLQELLPRYSEYMRRKNWKKANELRWVFQQSPYSSVLAAMLHIASGAGAGLIEPACLAALRAHPEIQTWLTAPVTP